MTHLYIRHPATYWKGQQSSSSVFRVKSDQVDEKKLFMEKQKNKEMMSKGKARKDKTCKFTSNHMIVKQQNDNIDCNHYVASARLSVHLYLKPENVRDSKQFDCSFFFVASLSVCLS